MASRAQPLVASVTADFTSGPVSAGTTITLHSPTWGSDIYYTTDGSDPRTAATRKHYSLPILAGALTLKAYATRVGMTDSPVSTFTYSLDPSSYVDITAHGAISGDGLDDTDEILAAISAAGTAGKAIFVPAGTFQHEGPLVFNGVDLVGVGPASILLATNPEEQNVRLQGSGVRVGDLKLTSTATTRKQANKHQRLIIDQASDFHVERVTIDGSSAAGIFNFGGQRGVIRDNRVMGTRADGIHNTRATSYVTVEYNEVSGTGDDLLAVVSYLAHGTVPVGPSHHITLRGNTVSGNTHGRGIAVLGGHTLTIEDNTVTSPMDGGIYVSSDGGYDTHGVSNVLVRGNTVSQAGGGTTNHGALMVHSSTSFPVTGVSFIGNHVLASRGRGALLMGASIGDVEFTGNEWDGTGGNGVLVDGSFTGNAVFRGNTLKNIGTRGLHLKDPSAAARVTFDGNTLLDVNRTAAADVDVIRVDPGSLTSLTLTHNVHTNPGGYPLRNFINENATVSTQVICGNSSPAANQISGTSQCVATVSARPAGGTVSAGALITLTGISGSTLYYTTDGSDPRTSTTRRLYSSPIVANTFTLKAYATRTGMMDSVVASHAYTLDASTYVDITLHGAIPNDGVDDTLALTSAWGLAELEDKAVFIPAGTFQHSDALAFPRVDLVGTGPGSILLATNPNQQQVRISGSGVTVSDVKLLSTSTTPGSGDEHQRLFITHADGFTVERVVVEGSSAAGIYAELATHGVIRGNTVSNTLRSGIYVTRTSAEVVIEDNTVTGTGDDLIAIASYQSQGADPVSAITVRRNTVSNNSQGTGVSVRGGASITIEGNHIIEPYVAGIYVSSGSSAGTHGVSGVQARGNEVHTAGGQTANHGALMVHATGLPVTDVTFSGNEVMDSRGRGVLLLGPSIGSVSFEDNHLSGTGGVGILVDGSFSGAASFTGNTVEGTDGPAFHHKLPQVSASIILDGNIFRDINRSSTAGTDVILLESGSLASLTITGNVHATPLTYPLEFFLQEDVSAGTQVISSNSSPLSSRINGVVVPTP